MEHSTSHVLQSSRYLNYLLGKLYGRVARRLNLDPSYVSMVARGKVQSARVEYALESELESIAVQTRKRQGATRRQSGHKAKTPRLVRTRGTEREATTSPPQSS